MWYYKGIHNIMHVFCQFTRAGISPLSFIFENTAYHGMESLLKKVVPQEGEELLTPFTCHSVSPDNCCKGSLVLCEFLKTTGLATYPAHDFQFCMQKNQGSSDRLCHVIIMLSVT